MEHKDKKHWIKRAEIFSNLSDSELEIIENFSELRAFTKDQEILTQGQRSRALCVIVSGKVHIMKTDQWEGSTLIAELVEGNILGELEFFTGTPFTESAFAAEDVELLVIESKGRGLMEIYEKFPKIGASMLYEFLRVFSGRLRKANILVKDNSAVMQELKRQVYGDKLTGLYNKTYLEETLPGLTVNTSQPVTLMLMKPDNFKMINDTFGHEAGDNTLKIMAAALNAFMEGRGTVLRYMGNELGIILQDYDRGKSLSEAGRVLEMFNRLDISSATGTNDVFLSMSIGIAVYPDHANFSDELIQKAHDLPLVGRSRGGNLILFPEDSEK